MFTLAAYTQHFDPVGNSLFASTIFAALPLIALFVLLGGLKWKAQWAALASLLVAILVAVIVYSMPVGKPSTRAWRALRSACSRSCGSSSTRSGSTT